MRCDAWLGSPLCVDGVVFLGAGAGRAKLLDLETGQSWKRNPMSYVYLPGNGIDGLMKRNFAPAAGINGFASRS